MGSPARVSGWKGEVGTKLQLDLRIAWTSLVCLRASLTAWPAFVALEAGQPKARQADVEMITLILRLRHEAQPVLDLPMLPIAINKLKACLSVLKVWPTVNVISR
jgi:hypothetical protein